jgi:hypothetical protein
MVFSIQLIGYLYLLIQTIFLNEQISMITHNFHVMLNDIYLVLLMIHLKHQLNFVPFQQLTNHHLLDNNQVKRFENQIQIVVIVDLHVHPNNVQYYQDHLSIHVNHQVLNQYNLHHQCDLEIVYKQKFF